jgi:hypothetical protein
VIFFALTTEFDVLIVFVVLFYHHETYYNMYYIVSMVSWYVITYRIGYGLYRPSPNNLHNVTVLTETPDYRYIQWYHKCTPHDITYLSLKRFMFFFLFFCIIFQRFSLNLKTRSTQSSSSGWLDQYTHNRTANQSVHIWQQM